jgi:hypothetical protein
MSSNVSQDISGVKWKLGLLSSEFGNRDQRSITMRTQALIIRGVVLCSDLDHDGTLSVQELRSKSARALKRLID